MSVVGWWRGSSDALVAVLHLLGGMRVAVIGASMEPALRAGDHLLVSRLAYRLRPPRRGDVVFLRSRAGGGAAVPECIKRVVGLPHERVQVQAGVVTVDGHLLPEPYLPPRTAASSAPATWRLGADEYFVLGDNRAHSSDSRSFGPVRRRAIIGHAWYRYTPAARRGRIG